MAACDLVTKLCRSLKQFILTLKEILLFFYPKKKKKKYFYSFKILYCDRNRYYGVILVL